MKVSLIVPCYNEEEVINLLYKEIERILKSLENNYEIIFVDDGSKDNTKQEIIKLSTQSQNVKYISFSRNFGKEAAMLAGMKYAQGDYIGIIDADLQHPPELIIEMIKALDEDFDVAAARRVNRIGETKVKSFFSGAFYGIMNKLADIDLKEGAQDYRFMKRKVVESILSMPEYHRFSKGIFSWVGFKTKWFEHENIERAAGKTKWNFFGLVKYAVNGIIAFSVVPLRVSLVFGVVLSVVGYIYAIRIVIGTLLAKSAGTGTGYASIMSVLLIIGGTVLICLGILGEYIARVYIEVKNRPIFIIDETNITFS